MALYIKEALFSWRQRFYIKDEAGADRYYTEGKLLSLGKNLSIYDMQGQERLRLQQVFLSMMPRYDLYIDGVAVCQVHARFSLFKPYFEIYGLNWNLEGDFFDHEYVINSAEGVVGSISKKWFSWGDSYRLDYANPEHELIVLGIVLAVDSARHDGED